MRPPHEETHLYALSLLPPTFAGQRRILRLSTRCPIFVEVEAVEAGEDQLQWRTVLIVSAEGALHDGTSYEQSSKEASP